MTCKIDNVKVFKEKQDYTTLCEACSLHCKIPHYRSCKERFEWNKQQGNDLMAKVRESNRLAQQQTGQKLTAVDGIQPEGASVPAKKDPKKKGSQRHRRGR